MPVAEALPFRPHPIWTSVPESLSALKTNACLTPLNHRLEDIAYLGTQLADATIITRNSGAVIIGRGGYGPVQCEGMPTRLCRHRVALRFAKSAVVQAVRTIGDDSDPIALVVADGVGKISHIIQLTGSYDRHIAMALDAGAEVWLPTDFQDIPLDVAPLSAIRALRANWSESAPQDHLDPFLNGRDIERRRALPYIGSDRAWPIIPNSLWPFLDQLTDDGTSFGRIVPATGLLQSDVGPLEMAKSHRGCWDSSSATAQFALDMNAVGSVWVTVVDWFAQLELYDAAGRGIAVLVADPLRSAEDWFYRLAALPRAN
ncbi:MAG: hypothetical protein AAF557_00120 [Pseudomonadota bacterium]